MIDLKYSQILDLNNKIGLDNNIAPYKIALLSNIIIHQSKDVLEYYFRSQNINAKVNLGEYDNIVQDSQKHKNANLVIIFWEVSNILDGLQYKIELLTNKDIDEIYNKTKSEIDFVLKNLEQTSLVLINRFTSLHFSFSMVKNHKLDLLTKRLNHYLDNRKQSNLRIIDIDKVLANVGISKSLDYRYYYSSKALYKIDFFKAYAEYIKPYVFSVTGKSKKAIIFDCDNTLWKGILGEDGFDNIEMSRATKDGMIYSEIQSLALTLHNQGILIGLCSKNNLDEVNEVIINHPDMQIKDDNIIIKKINWDDKATNLREISKELNIGLESLVFIDDSPFEVELIKKKLPEVSVLKVPQKLYEYPGLIRKNMGLFFNFSNTKEDSDKTEMYKQQIKRGSTKKDFLDIDDYLASLELKIVIHNNIKSIIPRISQMTQKTNQFNLTTKRYSENDIESFVNNPDFELYTFSVNDKFGDSGITGLVILRVNLQEKKSEIDTFLLSCRIIGRNIEYSIMDYIIGEIKDKNVNKIKSKYIKTLKNEQVKDFYENCSFDLQDNNDKEKNYLLELNNYIPKSIKYIKVINGK